MDDVPLDELHERGELLDLAQDAIFVRDFQSGLIRYWNRGAERLYGWTAAEARGHVSYELLRTRFAEPPTAILQSLVDSGAWEGELVHITRDGRHIEVSSRWSLRRTAAGQPSAILEVNTDITPRKRADVLLREQAALLDLVPDAILVRDFHGDTIKFWSSGAQNLFGWSESEATGRCEQVLLQTQLPRPSAELRTQLQARGQWQGEIQQVARDGRRLTLMSRWALRRDEHGEARDILVISTDITERKQAEQERARLELAEAALRERDQLLATVSHDLKTPLTAIRGQADLLLHQLDYSGNLEPERARKGLELLRTAATRMATWIDDLLDTARLEAGRSIELHRQLMDLVALAWQAAAEHQRSTDRHHLRVESSEPKLIGLWDPIRLRRVVDNLLSNAIKYSPQGGEIVIDIARDHTPEDPMARLAVRDVGVGIPAEDLPHIFERYRRAGNVVGRFGGTGIGLAGACQIIQEHGGRIDVDSQEGRGTTFTVYLPMRLRAR
jgi:PAS domain S-box-containing protein